jgi:hypothetical protein
MSCGFNLGVIRSGVAWAEASPDMSSESIKSLIHMARSLFPHADLADDVYTEIVDGMLSASADDPTLDSVLGQAVKALDAASDKDFFGLTEESQLQVINSLSESEFFEAIVNQVRLRLCIRTRNSGRLSATRVHRSNTAATSNVASTTLTGCRRTHNGQEIFTR